MPTQIGDKVQEFYNDIPFPDYNLDRFNSTKDLAHNAYPFIRILNGSIPKDATILDIGTGTGQLSAFLSLSRDCVWGIDFSDKSLNKAKQLKEKLHLNSWNLKKVDILDKKQIEEIGIQFDYVLCLGVLHHTGDAYQAFQNIVKLVKPGGYIAIGLYNKYGRLAHKMRMLLSKTIFKGNEKKKEKYIKIQINNTTDTDRTKGWWHDQYLHPHETCHTIDEVLKWFKKMILNFYKPLPRPTLARQA